MTAYTHIRVLQIPQRLDEDFVKNMDEADRQKRLAEAAPDLLAVAVEFVRRCEEVGIKDYNIKLLPIARAAIAKATGEEA